METSSVMVSTEKKKVFQDIAQYNTYAHNIHAHTAYAHTQPFEYRYTNSTSMSTTKGMITRDSRSQYWCLRLVVHRNIAYH
jgi:hypothetical protein